MRILLTGAAGRIGGLIIERLAETYDWLLTDLHRPADTRGLAFIPADITNLDEIRILCKGMDVILHLAAESNPEAEWQDLIQPNIVGIHNLFQSALEAGCRRVIFASSLHVIDGYPRDIQINTEMPISPLTLYGATKAWGEAVAAFYAYQKDLPTICLRIGWVRRRNDPGIVPGASFLDVILTQEDLIRLITSSIDAPRDLRFGIFNGISNNRWKRLDISNARDLLKYEPQDDAFAIARKNYRAILHQWGGCAKRVFRSMIHRK